MAEGFRLRLLAALALICLCFGLPLHGERKSKAIPLKVDGVPNLHRIDDNLYRSGQPTRAGFANLEAMGVKTVVSLSLNQDDIDLASGTLLRLYLVPLNPVFIDKDQVARALSILGNRSQGPYLVHCRHGSDRTGLICASYRIAYHGWSVEDAIDELVNGSFGHHEFLKNIPSWLRREGVGLKVRKESD